MIGRKAKVVDGFERDGFLGGNHIFEENEIVTLVKICLEHFKDGSAELWHYFVNEEGYEQILVESEFEFIEEEGE